MSKLIADLEGSEDFRTKMLGRFKRDCDYFLGHGGRHPKHLWCGEVQEHLEQMRALWESLALKPTWLTRADIDTYEVRMLME